MAVGCVLLTLVTDTNPLLPLPGVLVLRARSGDAGRADHGDRAEGGARPYAGLAAGVNTTVSRLGGLIATPLIGVVITLVFALGAPHPNADPFATHVLTPDQRDATVTAFRAGILAARAVRRRLGGGLRLATTSRRTTPLSGQTRVTSTSRPATIARRTAPATEAVFDTARERSPLFSTNRGYRPRDGCQGRVTERQRWPKRCLTPDHPPENRSTGSGRPARATRVRPWSTPAAAL